MKKQDLKPGMAVEVSTRHDDGPYSPAYVLSLEPWEYDRYARGRDGSETGYKPVKRYGFRPSGKPQYPVMVQRLSYPDYDRETGETGEPVETWEPRVLIGRYIYPVGTQAAYVEAQEAARVAYEAEIKARNERNEKRAIMVRDIADALDIRETQVRVSDSLTTVTIPMASLDALLIERDAR